MKLWRKRRKNNAAFVILLWFCFSFSYSGPEGRKYVWITPKKTPPNWPNPWGDQSRAVLPKSPQRQQAMWSVKPLANTDLRFQERTSVRMEIFGEKEENEGRERKNGHTAVWQILWDVVEGWWCFHCWHQHKFSWCGSPCPAWAQHWETGEEILRAAREWNQRAGAPGPLTHWTPRWPHYSLLFSHTQSYMHRHTHILLEIYSNAQWDMQKTNPQPFPRAFGINACHFVSSVSDLSESSASVSAIW